MYTIYVTSNVEGQPIAAFLDESSANSFVHNFGGSVEVWELQLQLEIA